VVDRGKRGGEVTATASEARTELFHHIFCSHVSKAGRRSRMTEWSGGGLGGCPEPHFLHLQDGLRGVRCADAAHPHDVPGLGGERGGRSLG